MINISTTTTFNQNVAKYAAEKQALQRAREMMAPITEDMNDLVKEDGGKNDRDKRPGFVEVEYDEGDYYHAHVAFDTKTREVKHFDSEFVGGQERKSSFDRGSGTKPDVYTSSVTGLLSDVDESAPIGLELTRKMAVELSRNGTVKMVEEQRVPKE